MTEQGRHAARGWTWWLVRGGGTVLLLALAGGIGYGLFLDRYGHIDRAAPADCIIVLGAGVIASGGQGVAGDSLRTRTEAAAALYHRGLAPYLLCTGGVGDVPPAEARVAADIAVSLGVPRDHIVLEARSTSTYENLANAAAICRARGWRRVIAVSDPYHLWRVRCLGRRVGLEVLPSPARHCLRDRDRWMRLTWTAREVLVVLKDRCLFG